MTARFGPLVTFPPLLTGGPRSQRPGFAEPKPPMCLGTIWGNRKPETQVVVMGGVQITPTKRVGAKK